MGVVDGLSPLHSPLGSSHSHSHNLAHTPVLPAPNVPKGVSVKAGGGGGGEITTPFGRKSLRGLQGPSTSETLNGSKSFNGSNGSNGRRVESATGSHVSSEEEVVGRAGGVEEEGEGWLQSEGVRVFLYV